jgi:hypothetical protein
MKVRLKKKTDMKKTGNKRIKLCEWEKIFYNLMDGWMDGWMDHISNILFNYNS